MIRLNDVDQMIDNDLASAINEQIDKPLEQYMHGLNTVLLIQLLREVGKLHHGIEALNES